MLTSFLRKDIKSKKINYDSVILKWMNLWKSKTMRLINLTEDTVLFFKKNIKGLISTANGRSKIMEAAQIREDEVWDRLQSPSIAEDFLYHMDNKCYKSYVLKKTLDNIKVNSNFCLF